MMPQGEACERKRQLLQDLLQILSRVSHINGTTGEITSRGAANEKSELEAMLRRAINEQQQALRALEDHQQEHGC
jgi:hypothetical protein